MRCNEIGVAVSREQFTAFLNGVKGGQFFHVRGYVNEQGERADHVLRFGIKYGNLKTRDVQVLTAVKDGTARFDVRVKHGVWVPNECLSLNGMTSPTGNGVTATAKFFKRMGDAVVPVEFTTTMNLMDDATFVNRKANGRTQVTLSYDLPSTHPLVLAAIGTPDTQGTLLQGLVNPRQAFADYDKEAQSCYSLTDASGQNKWYLRDVLRVHKTVLEQGTYDFKASSPIVAIKDAITHQHLLTGKYRQFTLTEGQFDAITIEGQSILCDGVDEEFYFALPETVREVAQAEAVA